MRKLWIMILASMLVITVSAQQDTNTPISMDNLDRFQSVAQVDFADFDTRFDTGAFTLSATGDHILLVSGERLILINAVGDVIGTTDVNFNTEDPTRLAAAAFVNTTDGLLLLTAHTDGLQQFIAFHRATDELNTLTSYELPTRDTPLAMWASVTGEDDLFVVLEVTYPPDNPYVLTLMTAFDGTLRTSEQAPYAPGLDEDAVVRIGRVPLPYEVTSSADGIVKLWRVFEETPLYTVDNGTGFPAVFGAINTPPTHLAWRDQASAMLYLLDLTTGENRQIDSLDGQYAQGFFVAPDASVILAVNLDFEPNVIAWDSVTGERQILGEYRQCERPQPDITKMSADGSTLVIGCDSGLDIWRVSSD